jgi:hypothetical protein
MSSNTISGYTGNNYANSSIGSTNYLDQALSFEMVRNLCNGKGNALSEIGKFILIIGMDQFKVLFKAIVDKCLEEIKQFKLGSLASLINPLQWIKWLYHNICRIFTYFKKRDSDKIELQPIKECKPLLNRLDLNINLQNSFWEFISSDSFKDHINYTIAGFENTTQKDNNTFIFGEDWYNVELTIPSTSTKMIFNSPVQLTFESKWNKKNVIKVNQKDITSSLNSTPTFTLEYYHSVYAKKASAQNSLVYDVTKFIQDKVFLNYLNSFVQSEFNNLKALDEKMTSLSFTQDYFIVNLYDDKYDYNYFFSTQHYYYHLICIGFLIYTFDGNAYLLKERKNTLVNKRYKLFLGYPSYTSTFDFIKIISGTYKSSLVTPFKILINKFYNSCSNIILTEDRQYNSEYKEFINNLCIISDIEPPFTNSQTQNKESSNHNCSNITILSSDFSLDLHKECLQFLTGISKQLKNVSNLTKIKTFEIKIEYKEVNEKIKNPDYEISKTRLEELKQLDKSEASEKLIAECIASTPPEFTTQIKFSKQVVCNPINEVYKSLDRLYLSKRDKHKLTNMLHDFRDDKTILEDLGLPNKLCVLLYGKPGCGKSSTIDTIGTYLQKDIYNLNLSSVKSNEDLGALWDYVTNKTSNGGCIVMEDIDASTDVVLSRDLCSINNNNTVVTPNETPLSLSYFLNILQGSFQRDNSVVIVTTNWIQKLDPAFTRSMRFDVKIDMKPADHDQMIEIFKVFFPKRDVPIELIKSIPEHIFTPAQFIDQFREHIKNSDLTIEELFEPFLTTKLIN